MTLIGIIVIINKKGNGKMFILIFLGLLIALLSGIAHYLYEEYYNIREGWQQYLFIPTCVMIGLFAVIEFGQIFKCIIDFLDGSI